MSSVAHRRGRINFEDLNFEKRYDSAEAYEQSKLANVIFTRELARRLEGKAYRAPFLSSCQYYNYIPPLLNFTGTGVTVNALHPGIVDTNIVRHMNFANSWFANIFLKPLFWPFIKTPERGAQTTLYAALDPSLEKVTGKYFK